MKKCPVQICLNKPDKEVMFQPAVMRNRQPVCDYREPAMVDTSQKSFTVMLREPDGAFPQKCFMQDLGAGKQHASSRIYVLLFASMRTRHPYNNRLLAHRQGTSH